ETVGWFGDHAAHASYEISGYELAALIRRRNEPAARKDQVVLRVEGGFGDTIDSHRGSLLCLIANNLIENAVAASAAGGEVRVLLERDAARVTLRVEDNGPGLPADVQAHLFEPGRSGRPGGSGLGLAI